MAPGKEPHIERLLSFELSKGRMERTPEGGLVVHDVKALAEGNWTDSAVGTPLFYPRRTLQEYAANWADNSFWALHAGVVPRRITDKIGIAANPRYNEQAGAVLVDLHLHGLTQLSRDAIALIEAGYANYVSVEHTGEEVHNPKTRMNEARTLQFLGLALVNRGACKVCTIRDNAAKDGNTGDTTMDEKVLEAQLSAKADVKSLEALQADNKALRDELTKAQTTIKELADAPAKIGNALKAIEELQGKVKALEASGAGSRTFVPSGEVDLKDAVFIGGE
jgi:hypothetical protein